MIAAWMLFALTTGALLGIVGALMEAACLRARVPVRGAWLGVMMAAVGVCVWGAWPSSAARDAGPVEVVTVTDASIATSMSSVFQTSKTASRSTLSAPATIPIAAVATRAITSYRLTERWLRMRAAALDTLLLSVWATVSVVLLLWMLVASWHAHRLPDDRGPAVTGVFRPRMLIPHWVRELPAPLRRLVLQHEREHVLARDPLLLFVAMSLPIVFPWHAPLWWMLRRLRAAIELDCDARVLRTSHDVRAYGALLVAVAARRQAFPSPMLVMSIASGRRALRRRIVAITAPTRPRTTMRIAPFVAGAALVTAAVLSVPSPFPLLNAQRAPVVAPRARAATEQPRLDSAVEFRYVMPPAEKIFKDGHRQIAALRAQSPDWWNSDDERFVSIRVTTQSGRRADIQAYLERMPGDSTFRAETTHMKVPFMIMRSDVNALHMQSLYGDTLIVSQTIPGTRGLRSQVRGLHVVLRGMSRLSVAVP